VRPALPAVLLLLSAAVGTASAECAWVMWRGAGDPEFWVISDSFDSRQKCVEKIARIRQRVSDDNRSTPYDTAGERIETRLSYRWPNGPWEYLNCLPVGVSPR
jgi:hypothetical protein